MSSFNFNRIRFKRESSRYSHYVNPRIQHLTVLLLFAAYITLNVIAFKPPSRFNLCNNVTKVDPGHSMSE